MNLKKRADGISDIQGLQDYLNNLVPWADQQTQSLTIGNLYCSSTGNIASLLTYGLTVGSNAATIDSLGNASVLTLEIGGNALLAGSLFQIGEHCTIDTGPGTVTASQFVGGGAGLTGLDASYISSGTLNAARLPTITESMVSGLVSDLAAKATATALRPSPHTVGGR